MSLTPGTRLGSFEIAALIGVGGMGEVYRATDTSLKRQVAIKVLPQSVSGVPDRLARFQREAEALASLNHQNIAQIYGLEKSDGAISLVMELVDGPTLADRIAHGAVAVDEALRIAKQIAAALEAAHERGIIHRDLKPANIKLRPDGTVKMSPEQARGKPVDQRADIWAFGCVLSRCSRGVARSEAMRYRMSSRMCWREILNGARCPPRHHPPFVV